MHVENTQPWSNAQNNLVRRAIQRREIRIADEPLHEAAAAALRGLGHYAAVDFEGDPVTGPSVALISASGQPIYNRLIEIGTPFWITSSRDDAAIAEVQRVINEAASDIKPNESQ